jgi:hypothetical protein
MKVNRVIVPYPFAAVNTPLPPAKPHLQHERRRPNKTRLEVVRLGGVTIGIETMSAEQYAER